MKRFVWFARTGRNLAGLAIVVATLAANPARAEQGSETNAIIPLIVMDEVPLLDAIKNLAAQAHINYIIAPEIASPFQSASAESAAQRSPVTARWENLSAEKALAKLMAERKLAMTDNPETSIKRISGSNDRRTPTGVGLIAGKTNVIPLVVMDEVPLADALKNLARVADLNVTLDHRLTDPGSKFGISRQTISIRWHDISAAQGLAALLDNYDLVLAGISNSTAQITARSLVGAGMDRPGPRN